MKNKASKKSGFTLLELLISIAIIVIIGGFSVPIYFSFQSRNEIDITVATAAQKLRRAQLSSQEGISDLPWGVYFNDEGIVLFQGESYQTRSVDFDELFSPSKSIFVSGIEEIIFERITGRPNNTGEVSFSLASGFSKSIFINKMGTISYRSGDEEGGIDEECNEGSGTEEDPYLICTVDQLSNIREDLSAYYRINNDINLNVNPYNSGGGWEPIGSQANPFTGVLDGSGKIISNLYINRPTETYNGLFGYISADPGKEAGVYSLGLEGVNINGGGFTGSIVGRINGVWNADGVIKNSYAKGDIVGGGSTGGIAGYTAYKSYLEDVYAVANIEGGWGTGGISGSHWGGNNIIKNSYSSSTIVPGSGKGGVIGQGNSSVVDTYWNTDLYPTSPLGEGKSTVEMKNISTFSNWNVSVSSNNLNDGYPHLAWQENRNDYKWLIYE